MLRLNQGPNLTFYPDDCTVSDRCGLGAPGAPCRSAIVGTTFKIRSKTRADRISADYFSWLGGDPLGPAFSASSCAFQ